MRVGGAATLFSVTTPEGVPLPFTIASAGDRMLAFLLDFLIIFLGSIVTLLAGLLLAGAGLRGLGIAVALVGVFAWRNAYFVVCEARWGGRTIGKRATGLRVIARDGGPLTAEAVLARNLTREVEVFLPLTILLLGRRLAPGLPGWALLAATLWLFVAALLPLAGKERLRCGDLVAGTLVVQAPVAVLLPDLATLAAPAGRGAGRGTLGAGGGISARAGAGGAGGARAGAGGGGLPPGVASPYAPEPAWAATAPVRAVTAAPAAAAAAAAGAPEADVAFSREQLDIYGIHELQVLEDLLRREADGAMSYEVLEEVAAKIKAKIGWPAERRQMPAVPWLRAFYRAQRARLEQKLLFGERQERKRDPGRSPAAPRSGKP
jgi:uncharacterized RDD family membrane protein YckC